MTVSLPKADNEAQPPVQGACQPDPAEDFEKFIYLLSHDVRNSARALMEVPQWIEEDLVAEGHKIDGDLAENLELLNTHASRLDRLLVDLLAYSRVGRLQTIEAINLGETLQEVLKNLDLPAGFCVHQDLAATKLRLGGRDAYALLYALVSNAVKHHDTQAGTTTISSRQTQGSYTLRIDDDGPGIDPKYHDRVFGALTTLKPRDVVEGSGMGLATARKIATFYGGDIALSQPPCGKGTSVLVTIPNPPD